MLAAKANIPHKLQLVIMLSCKSYFLQTSLMMINPTLTVYLMG